MASKKRTSPIPRPAAASVKEYYAAALDAAGKAKIAGEFDDAIGVFDRPAAAGETVDIHTGGIVSVKLGGTVAAGQALRAGSDGRLVAADSRTDRTLGTALAGGAEDDIVSMVVSISGAAGAVIRSYTAGAALAAGRLVQLTSDTVVGYATSGGSKTIGVTLAAAADGAPVRVCHLGLATVEFVGAVNRGQNIQAGADGKGSAAQGSSVAIGYALEEAAAGQRKLALISPHTA